MNPIYRRFSLGLQALLLASLFVLEWSSQRYMTMMRIVLYQNRRLESVLPMKLLTGVLTAAFLILALWAVYRLIRKPHGDKSVRDASSYPTALLAITASAATVQGSLNSAADYRTYYYSLAVLALMCLLQLPAALHRS